MKKVLSLIILCSVFISCQQEDEAQPDDKQKSTQIDKHGSVEVKILQKQLGDTAVAITTQKFFYDLHENLLKISYSFDTVPSLGRITDTLDTGRTYTDANGDDQELDTIVNHPKNYQFFITVN